MFFRKLGKLLRGKATPFQIISATVLGSLIGSLPGIGQGPLLLVLLLFLVIVLNANIFLMGLSLLAAKLLTLILLPVTFKLGVFLLEGPLNGILAGLVNAPVTAWFGLEFYVTVPSLLVGGLFGLLVGLYLTRLLRTFRKKMASLEEGSERYQAYSSKVWVKVLAWIFVGGLKGKKSWAELSESRKGLPIRPLGIVFVLSLCVLLFVGFKLLDQTIVTAYIRDGLEQANGATVDLDSIDIQATQNRVVVSNLALADPENLQTNRFESRELVAEISGMNLLAKKMVIDLLRVAEPKTGTERRLAGRRTVPAPEPVVEPEDGEDRTLDDYLEQAKVWRERLATLKRVYDRLAPAIKKDDEETVEEEVLNWRERLAQQAREAGYANVKADSLIRNSPRLWIRQVEADDLEVGLEKEIYSINASNLSTQPFLLEETGILRFLRGDGNFEVSVALPSSSSPSRSVLKVRYSDLAMEDLQAKVGDDLPMRGGSMDISGEGAIDEGIIDLPITVTLKQTTLSAFGATVPVDGLPIQVRVYGPLDNPKLAIPEEALKEAIQSGGKKQIQNLIEDRAGESLRGLFPRG